MRTKIRLEPEVSRMLGYISTPPNFDLLFKINELIKELKAINFFQTTDVLYINCFENESDNWYNWINPNLFKISLSRGGIKFIQTSNKWVGVSNGGLETSYNPSIHGVNYTITANTIGVYTHATVNGMVNVIGCSDGTNRVGINPRNGERTKVYNNGATQINGSNYVYDIPWGVLSIERFDSMSISISYTDRLGDALSPPSAVVTALPNQTVVIGGLNLGSSIESNYMTEIKAAHLSGNAQDYWKLDRAFRKFYMD